MKNLIFIILIFPLILASAPAQADLTSPRDTFKTFLKSMVAVKENRQVEQAYARAATTLDLTWVDSAVREEVARKASEALIGVFDKLERIDYAKIPEEFDGDYWVYDKRSVSSNGEQVGVEISLKMQENQWRFSRQTIESLPLYTSALQGKSTVQGVAKLSTWRENLHKNLPEWSKKNWMTMAYWQWIGLVALIALAYLVEKVISIASRALINKNVAIFKRAPNEMIKKATIPFGKIILLYILHANLYWLDLEPTQLAFIKRSIYVLSALAAVWLGHRLVEIMAFYLREKATTTASKFDDIMVPLISKTSFILVYVFGVILVLRSFTVDVTGLLAGLGIGGLAFAFAAKDTLANFFGSIMLVLDRPFDIGDIITAGDIEGTVVEVGFRSTRIRTFYDSIITISNGDLMNRSIDNKGKRRYRRLNSTLGVEYDTPPTKVEAFCEGIRQLILSHKWTRKDNFHVYFTNFGASSLDIQLVVFWETDDYAREQAEKHRLMIDILRLAKELDVNFAFPTQTVHLFQEQSKTVHDIPDKYLDEGIGRAKNLLSQPLSLKNPRSNATDEDQFGKNDIGI